MTKQCQAVVFVGLLLVAFALLRFVNLDADFAITSKTGGVAFTDEGWYANSAIRFVTGQDWYQAGDFNPAVVMPLGQIIYLPLLKIFGIGLETLRLVAALASVIGAALMGRVASRERGLAAGLFTALLILLNYEMFIYSRLAIVEPLGIAFACAAFLFAVSNEGVLYKKAVIAGIFSTFAILTKSNMIFIVPVTMLAPLLVRDVALSRRLKVAAITMLVPLVVVLCHQAIIATFFGPDQALFRQINVVNRLVDGPKGWLISIAQLGYHFVMFYPALSAYVGVSLIFMAIVSRPFWRNRLVQLLLAWVIAYLFILSFFIYKPSRYFLPLVAPLSMLAILATFQLREDASALKAALLYKAQLLMTLVYMGVSGALIAFYMVTPQYSWRDMTLEVGKIVAASSNPSPLLIGNIADAIAAQTGVPAMNSQLVSGDLHARIGARHPTYAIVMLGDPDASLDDIRAAGGMAHLEKRWQVYARGRFPGREVSLYRLEWPKGPGSAS